MRGGARVSRKSSPTSIFMHMRSNCNLGVGAFRRSMFLSRHSQCLAVFAHPLESRRDRLLYPQRVLLEKGGGGGGQLPLLHPPGYATAAKRAWFERVKLRHEDAQKKLMRMRISTCVAQTLPIRIFWKRH